MPKVSIIVPTFNEQENIGTLIKEIKKVGNYDILVVDDGTDDTQKIARENGAEVLQGCHRGLGQAIIDGINEAKTPIVLVMDADLSHPASAIPDLVLPLLNGYDMTVGSRYCNGGATEGWELTRRIISRCACLLALPITTVKDSTSGLFALRKEILEGVKLEGRSWKTMLEILVKAKPLRVLEVPFTFKVRQQGKSKFNKKQMVAYLKHLVSLLLYKYNRFLKFCVVGGTGAIETFAITWVLTEWIGMWYMASMVIAVAFATISNFIFNSIWTFSVGKDMNDEDYEWEAYYKGNFIQKWWKHSIVNKVVEMLPADKKSLSFLDIGCGASPMAIEIGSHDYTGIDSNKKKIQFMRNKLPYYAYVYEPEYQSKKQSDVVMAIEVIEHLPDMLSAGKFIRSMVDLTKSGGTVIIATPDYNKPLWRVVEHIYGVLMPSAYANDHKVKFNEETLIKICESYGLVHTKTNRVLGCDMVCRFIKKG